MALNSSRLGRSKQLARGGGGSFFKMKNGKNTLRFFSFLHEAEQSDFDRGIYKKSDGIKIGEEFDEVERVCYVHFTDDGVENCVRVNCPICEKSDEYLQSTDKADLKLGRDLKANKRFYVNMVDMENVDAGIQIVPLPGSVFNSILEYLMDTEYGDSVLGCKGRDFIISRDTNLSPDKMYGVKLRDKDRCEELDEELQSSVNDLFKMKNLDAGWSSDKDADADKGAGKASSKPKDDGKPASTGKASTKAKDPDDDDKPAGKAAKGKDDDENGFEDKEDGKASNMRADGRKQKREIPDWVKKDAKCVFTNKKKEDEEGVITGKFNTDEETIEVETDTSFWDLDYDDVRPLKAKGKERNRK